MTAPARVPYFGLDREHLSLREELMGVTDEVLRSGQVLQGPWVRRFEEVLRERIGRRHAVAVGSCTDALAFALTASGIGRGDEVLVPAVSFIATAAAVARVGAVPVFCDVDADGNLDLAHAAKSVGRRTSAVLFVHLYGRMGAPDDVERLASDHGLVLVEDAAQAFGAVRAGRPAGALGYASCLSFDPTKPLAAPGSGGVVLTDDDDIAMRVRRLRYHGRDEGRRFVEIGGNSQMSSLVAAILLVKLAHEERWRSRRRAVAARYLAGLGNIGLGLPAAPRGDEHVYHKFVVRTPLRDGLAATLAEADLQTMVHYAEPMHRAPVFAGAAVARELPVAEAMCAEVLSLPMHAHLHDHEVDRVIEAVRAAVAGPDR